jgi:hypothetical protein
MLFPFVASLRPFFLDESANCLNSGAFDDCDCGHRPSAMKGLI